jgi:LacI family transcriptional regulator
MNLETIAQLSGVSRSTVSRVINNSPNVSPEVRERVMRVIRETNFQPNVAARSLAAGSTRILGLVIPMAVNQVFVDPYFPLLVQGVSSACNARDYTVMLWLVEPEYERRIMRQILHSGLIDGVIITSIRTDDPLVDALLDRNFPVVMIGRPVGGRPIPYIDVDNTNSARQAVTHLVQLGRKRIVTIAGPQSMIAGIDRLKGYRLALEQAGLPYQPDDVEFGDFTQEGGYRAMLRLLPQRPDAVFSASDAMAQGAIRAISEAGLRTPEDVSVVGFDDMPFAAHLQPPLTTVRQPIYRLGTAAVDYLIDLLNGSGEGKQLLAMMPTELIIRESCGGKPAA